MSKDTNNPTWDFEPHELRTEDEVARAAAEKEERARRREEREKAKTDGDAHT